MAWIPGVTAATGGAAAAAAAAKQREEEEDMTRYTAEELNDDWEFKIVRSIFGAFGSPAKLRHLLAEEARAGWVMVEKFDDQRVRFKRPRSAREQDHLLPEGVDPYRTEYGTGMGAVAAVVLGLVLLVILGVLFAVMMAAR